MIIKILGSAAAGGFPLWNCTCQNCSRMRAGSLRSKPRTHSQIAFSPLDGVWFLLGASPDLRSQLIASPELSPAPDSPSPLAGLFLPSSRLEDTEGLLQLYDIRNTFVFASAAVQRIVRSESRNFPSLDGSKPSVQWQALSARRRIGCHLSDNPGDAPTFFYTAIPLGGPYPSHLSEESRRNLPADESHTAFLLEQADRKTLIAPRIFGGSSEWLKVAETADVAFLDARDSRELMETLPRDSRTRKILLRIDHQNPLLDEESDEHRAAVEAGFEIAYDGMEVTL